MKEPTYQLSKAPNGHLVVLADGQKLGSVGTMERDFSGALLGIAGAFAVEVLNEDGSHRQIIAVRWSDDAERLIADEVRLRREEFLRYLREKRDDAIRFGDALLETLDARELGDIVAGLEKLYETDQSK
jgi:hypothetical protein